MGGEVEELLRARRYDEALERLLQDYQGRVFRMALTILRDSGRAEEVTQDVFLKLWRALPAYDGRAAVTTWLYTIARNTCLTAVRAAGYRRTSSLDDVTEPGAATTTPLKVSVDQCLARLPESPAPGDYVVLSPGAQRVGSRRDARPAGRHGEEPPAPGPPGARRDDDITATGRGAARWPQGPLTGRPRGKR